MYPVLFSFDFFGFPLVVHSYGALIALGALSGFTYASVAAKRQLGISSSTMQGLARTIIIAAFVGEKPFFTWKTRGSIFSLPPICSIISGTGFVFYGSLLFVIPSVIVYFRKYKLPVMPMLDIMAIAGLIIHTFGRMGCFMAGCCFGKPTSGPVYVQFTHADTVAPLNEHLHPTQLYSVALLLCILTALLMFKRHKRFEGQLFFIYIMLYAIGRGIIEIFRGDISRGYIIEDVLSHSQLVSLILLVGVGWVYAHFSKKRERIP